MRLRTRSCSSKLACFCLFLAIPATIASAADLVLRKAPPLTVRQAPAYPENVARYHFGAAVIAWPQSVSLARLQLSSASQDHNTSEAALLCDDPTTGYQLAAGESGVFVSLSNIENVASLSFLNDGAQGSFAIAISNADVPENSPQWRAVGNGVMSQGAISMSIGPGEVKYIKLTFKITHPGRIAAFGVYATPVLSDFTMPRPRKVSFEESSTGFALINFNFSDLHARARGLYASSGDLEHVNHLIDDQPATSYKFAAGDASPTVIVDLGRERNLSRLAASYASQAGSVDFYVLRTMPPRSPNDAAVSASSNLQQVANITETADLPASLEISEEAFADLKPVGSVVSAGEGRAAVDFPATVGRYVLLKWHPASAQEEAFSIAQVAAFGPPRPFSTTESSQMTDGKATFDGKEMIDTKESPKEGPPEALPPEEGPPPALPPVPPFSFIPQVPPVINPTSP
jgi:hypothetical protein